MKKDIPAFPCEEKVKRLNSSGSGSEVVTAYHSGMTLRDYFAAKALSNIAEMYNGIAFDPISTARAAYQFADAMLVAREVKHEHD